METGNWIEEDLGFTNLAKGVGLQVQEFLKRPVHVPKLLTWHRQLTKSGVIDFGFFSFTKERYKMFDIYNSNKKYMYTLVEMEDESCQIPGNNLLKIKNIDPVFIENVIQIVPQYCMKMR